MRILILGFCWTALIGFSTFLNLDQYLWLIGIFANAHRGRFVSTTGKLQYEQQRISSIVNITRREIKMLFAKCGFFEKVKRSVT